MGVINVFKLLFTFLKPVPLINFRNINNFSSEMLGIEPKAAGPGNKNANHCAMIPLPIFSDIH